MYRWGGGVTAWSLIGCIKEVTALYASDLLQYTDFIARTVVVNIPSIGWCDCMEYIHVELQYILTGRERERQTERQTVWPGCEVTTR